MSSLSFSRSLMHLFLLSLFSLTIEAAPTYVYHSCENSSNFTANSTFQSNLNILRSSLSSNATSVKGFYNSTAGRNPADLVYGLFLCRGDVTNDTCQECVQAATQEIVQRCPTQKDATIWYDECLLRYSNQYIFDSVDATPTVYLWNTANVTDPTRFNELVATTMNEIASLASNDSSKFATKEANFSGFQQLYTLAQCTQDLSSSVCNRCLREVIGQLPTCCSGRPGGRVLNPSCNVRYETYPFYQLPVVPPPASVPASEPRPKGKGGVSSSTIIAIAVPIAASGVILAIGCCFIIRRSRKKGYAMQGNDDVENDITNAESLQFDLATIQVATDNFSDENKLGEGGFGVVYKGTLPNGQVIAVKRLSQSSGQGAEEFKNEVVLVAKLQHRNLVRLLGFCLEGEEKILAYEFVPNKSLDYFLFDNDLRGQLDWSRRYKIIGGIARGMLYLHEDSRLRIIHRDLKASNILLDGDMNPKISDFGMARIFGVDQTQGNTSRIVGTYGYMSPEYAMHGQFSGKSDVYSFGVLILETISGKKNSFYQSDFAEDLLSFAWKHWRNGTPLEVLDPTLMDSYSRNEVIRCIHIGLLCVQEDPEDRPTMASIVLMLNSYSVTLALPQNPAFFPRSRTESNMPEKALVELDQSGSKSMPWSVNEASITEVHPR